MMTGPLALLLAFLAPVADKKRREPAPPAAPLPASVDELPIGAIPPQDLPAGGCAAFLWTKTPSHALVAMVTANPAQVRFAPGGTITDLARSTQSGDAGLGFATTATYAGGDATVTIDMAVVTRSDLKDGATVPDATLRFDRTGQDTIIVPVAGLIGCGTPS